MNFETAEMMNAETHAFVERAARIEPNNAIQVFDSESHEMIGTVVNFNKSGMQLRLNKKMYLNQIQEVTLVVENAKNEKQYIKVIAELLWLKQHENEGAEVGGFYLASKNFKSKFRLDHLIKSCQ